MKTLKCHVCETTFKASRADARYCTPVCRKKASRVTVKASTPVKSAKNTEDIQDDVTESLPAWMTPVDKEFEQSDPGYYKFSPTKRTVTCFACSKSFETHLSLLKNCSIKCQQDMFAAFSGSRK